jgi:glycosyltransferase involved in cell wall biosynthesis
VSLEPPHTRRPRILVLVTLAETGGAQSYVAGLLPGLQGRYDVVVAAHGDGPLREASRAAGARFVPLRHVRRPLHPARDLLGLIELVVLMRRAAPDIVHANSSKAGVLGRLAAAAAGVPIRIFTVHGWAFSASSGLVSVLYRWADRLMAPLTTLTICVAERERTAGLAARTCIAERTVVIPNAIDVEAIPQARHDGGPPLVVAVGRLAEPKDAMTLVRALAAVPGRRFAALLVGDGPDRPCVEEEVNRLGVADAVALVGTRDDVPALLAGADVFALSSRSEGAPISILEAMAAGLPVVSSRVGGVPELVVDGETGLLVPPGDPAAMSAALGRLVADADLRRRLGGGGRGRGGRGFWVRRQRRAHLACYARELGIRGLPAPAP